MEAREKVGNWMSGMEAKTLLTRMKKNSVTR